MKHQSTNKFKILNDPIYGFISIQNEIIFDLIEHPYFQRLRRITQLGLTYLVYPGAYHTRFHHALGAMHLTQRAIEILRAKNQEITDDESIATQIAILLHDIGHGPFSHALENTVVKGIHHEELSVLFMQKLNKEFGGKLDLAIRIFENKYEKKFLHDLISSQLDMDRLDYLRRDSFYTGVAEGTVNSERLIAMLNVKDDSLVVEEKGIYSVEKFIVARRLMYWQVYLHKTGIVAEQLLVRVLQRAKQLTSLGIDLPASKALTFFLKNQISEANLTTEVLETFSKLDDYDVISAMKEWVYVDDFVLKNLSEMLLHRDLLKVKVKPEPFSEDKLNKKRKALMDEYNISADEAAYFVFTIAMQNQAYSMEKDTINLLYKSGKVVEVAKASDQLNLEALSKSVVKYYLCYPKNNPDSYRG